MELGSKEADISTRLASRRQQRAGYRALAQVGRQPKRRADEIRQTALLKRRCRLLTRVSYAARTSKSCRAMPPQGDGNNGDRRSSQRAGRRSGRDGPGRDSPEKPSVRAAEALRKNGSHVHQGASRG